MLLVLAARTIKKHIADILGKLGPTTGCHLCLWPATTA
jgi:DNA-binding NarL/FixJ family response regulator